MTGSGESSPELFQCQSSSERNGQVFTPNIPDTYFNHTTVSQNTTVIRLSAGDLHIFAIPPLPFKKTCNGSVVSLEYCYRARQVINNPIPIFRFFSLKQDGFQYIVDQRFIVESQPRASICSTSPDLRNVFCCDRTDLDTNIELKSPSSYTFGVLIRPRELLAFADSAAQYHTQQFIIKVGDFYPDIGTNFSVTEKHFTNQSIPLLRFVIGMILQAV